MFIQAAYAASTLPARPYAPSREFQTVREGATPAWQMLGDQGR